MPAAAGVCVGRVDVADDAASAGRELSGCQVHGGDGVSAAQVGGQARGQLEHRAGVVVAPLAGVLCGVAGVFDLEAVGVRAGGGPRGVRFVDAAHDRVVVDDVVRARAGGRGGEPVAGDVLGDRAALGRLNGVDDDDADVAGAASREVRGRDRRDGQGHRFSLACESPGQVARGVEWDGVSGSGGA